MLIYRSVLFFFSYMSNKGKKNQNKTEGLKAHFKLLFSKCLRVAESKCLEKLELETKKSIGL